MEDRNHSETLMVVASQFSEERDYWLNQLSGYLEKIGFPYANQGTHTSDQRAAPVPGAVRFELPQLLVSRLMKISSGSDAKLHIILVAAVILLLNKYNYDDIEDIIIGVPIYRQEVKGRLVNTVLALRNHLEQTMTFKELILQLHQVLKEAVKNQNYPIEALLYQLGMPSGQEEFPLFDLAVLLENVHDREYLGHINLNMLYSFLRKGKTIKGLVEYNPTKYHKRDVERINGRLIQLMQHAVFDINAKLSLIEIVSEEEKNQILCHFNHKNAHVAYPGDKTIHQLFEEKVVINPDKIGLVGSKQYAPGSFHITYAELNRESNQLARLLHEKGMQADTIVGMMVEPSSEMIIGILAVLKAGGAYLPIEPDYPAERITFMLKDSNAKIFLSGKSKLSKVSVVDDVIELSSALCNSPFERGAPQGRGVLEPAAHKPQHGTGKGEPICSPYNLAYVIYTSGTTGKPKGSLVEHRNVVQLMFHDNYLFDFNCDDTWTMFHSYCFDFSVWEMYGALLYGGKLVVVPKMTARDFQQFLQILKEENVTILNQTPAAFYNLSAQELESSEKKLHLRYVIFGGEALKPAKLKQWQKKYPETKMINMFGITETTVHVTYKELDERDIRLNTNKIGRPISTLSTYVMDKRLKLVPGGVAGELCVGGEGVCRGYLNRPELTAKKFIENPYKPGERLYRSGDLTQFAENGEMEYLGRIDHQVKIRGYRIELAEIEHQLLKHHEIREAIVLAVAKSKNPGKAHLEPEDKYLCAYFVSGGEVSVLALREYLSKMLPDFMIPSYFMQVEKIPLTTNGKIDGKALPEPEAVSGTTYLAPRDEIEEKLVELWSEVLGTSAPIGIDDNFFELGGHSLRATVMAAKVHKVFNVKLPLAEIFTTPTLRKLGEYIKGRVKETYTSIEPVEKKDYYASAPVQKGLYILQQMDEQGVFYNQPNAFTVKGNVDEDKLAGAFEQLIKRHESLRTSFHMPENEDGPVLRIHEAADTTITVEYYEHADQREEMRILSTFIRPFDLSQAPLLRVGLIKRNRQTYLLMLDMHHIMSDGISHDILEHDFISWYEDEGNKLPELKLQYKDYLEWQNSVQQQQLMKRQEEYWLKVFEKDAAVLNIPTDYPRPEVQSFEGSTVPFEIGIETTQTLKMLASKENATIHIVMLAIFNAFLARLSRQEDIIIGITTNGRPHADLDNIVGMFPNTLPLRNSPHREKTFLEFLREVKKNSHDVYENQDYPFQELVKKVPGSRGAGWNPLFDILFEVQNRSQPTPKKTPGKTFSLEVQKYGYDRKISVFDMIWTGRYSGENIFFSVAYNTRLYKKVSVELMIDGFLTLIESVKQNVKSKIKDLDYKTDIEKELNHGMAIDFKF
jgi:amino acid adenylation domain-containing protein